MYVIDTYAWLEYFSNPKEKKLAGIIEGESDICTPSLAFSELKRVLLRKIRLKEETKEGMEQRLNFKIVHSRPGYGNRRESS